MEAVDSDDDVQCLTPVTPASVSVSGEVPFERPQSSGSSLPSSRSSHHQQANSSLTASEYLRFQSEFNYGNVTAVTASVNNNPDVGRRSLFKPRSSLRYFHVQPGPFRVEDPCESATSKRKRVESPVDEQKLWVEGVPEPRQCGYYNRPRLLVPSDQPTQYVPAVYEQPKKQQVPRRSTERVHDHLSSRSDYHHNKDHDYQSNIALGNQPSRDNNYQCNNVHDYQPNRVVENQPGRDHHYQSSRDEYYQPSRDHHYQSSRDEHYQPSRDHHYQSSRGNHHQPCRDHRFRPSRDDHYESKRGNHSQRSRDHHYQPSGVNHPKPHGQLFLKNPLFGLPRPPAPVPVVPQNRTKRKCSSPSLLENLEPQMISFLAASGCDRKTPEKPVEVAIFNSQAQNEVIKSPEAPAIAAAVVRSDNPTETSSASSDDDIVVLSPSPPPVASSAPETMVVDLLSDSDDDVQYVAEVIPEIPKPAPVIEKYVVDTNPTLLYVFYQDGKPIPAPEGYNEETTVQKKSRKSKKRKRKYRPRTLNATQPTDISINHLSQLRVVMDPVGTSARTSTLIHSPLNCLSHVETVEKTNNEDLISALGNNDSVDYFHADVVKDKSAEVVAESLVSKLDTSPYNNVSNGSQSKSSESETDKPLSSHEVIANEEYSNASRTNISAVDETLKMVPLEKLTASNGSESVDENENSGGASFNITLESIESNVIPIKEIEPTVTTSDDSTTTKPLPNEESPTINVIPVDQEKTSNQTSMDLDFETTVSPAIENKSDSVIPNCEKSVLDTATTKQGTTPCLLSVNEDAVNDVISKNLSLPISSEDATSVITTMDEDASEASNNNGDKAIVIDSCGVDKSCHPVVTLQGGETIVNSFEGNVFEDRASANSVVQPKNVELDTAENLSNDVVEVMDVVDVDAASGDKYKTILDTEVETPAPPIRTEENTFKEADLASTKEVHYTVPTDSEAMITADTITAETGNDGKIQATPSSVSTSVQALEETNIKESNSYDKRMEKNLPPLANFSVGLANVRYEPSVPEARIGPFRHIQQLLARRKHTVKKMSTPKAPPSHKF